MALLAMAFEWPIDACVLAKIRRAVALSNEGEKALAHFHLAFVRLPPCEEMNQALCPFVADKLIEAGPARNLDEGARGRANRPAAFIDRPLN